ncbi:conserved exported hypothetical protein [Cupriavidus taiwanensis]|uniref:Lipoprotein n=1 Tax=Cupriavidus taiwanensis TaxID=164546 RepID=A0A375ECG0_9BURK|nr:hypothetical protein [Cupriavidus taiwanensis]SOZ69082.1 conserved exported hypothetical protein [Cupriavidus taiwanensis]SOZ70194.1 conserved exported hypothetical protein [Cupriavidus taiwanensis]SOZ73061.1 conserved exported hypothetical protein [Cupriavidus taiwanensis]SPA02907.1 conserved exported hypothetical protein [Cupriavidus taiwanensis]SPA09963.1 conserved exported hypothetical protein [Cupriavidus taiwanensis]
MRPTLLSHSARPWLAAGTLTLALMLAACGGDGSSGAGGTLQPSAQGNAPDAGARPGHTGKPETCATRCAP